MKEKYRLKLVSPAKKKHLTCLIQRLSTGVPWEVGLPFVFLKVKSDESDFLLNCLVRTKWFDHLLFCLFKMKLVYFKMFLGKILAKFALFYEILRINYYSFETNIWVALIWHFYNKVCHFLTATDQILCYDNPGKKC